MTALLSWICWDGKDQSSVYICADSRFTYGGSKPPNDFGRKVFTSLVSPDIFGYCGTADLCAAAIRAALDYIPSDDRWIERTGNERWRILSEILEARIQNHYLRRHGKSSILYCTSTASNSFHAFRLDVSEEGDVAIGKESLTLQKGAPGESAVIECFGTGEDFLKNRIGFWVSAWGAYSRSFFSAFCDFLRDPRCPHTCGGAPQLVCLLGVYPGSEVGVHFSRNFIGGKPSFPPTETVSQWRNETFERWDPMRDSLVEGAQKQPRPNFPPEYYPSCDSVDE